MSQKSSNKNYTRRDVISTLGAAVVGTSTLALPATADAEEAPTQAITQWRVERYSFGWNAARRTGRVNLHLQNVRNPIAINVASPQEFSGYLAILKEDEVYYNSGGWVYTGTEPIS